MKKLKMIIAPAFERWPKQASPEDLKRLARSGNDLAAALRTRKQHRWVA